MIASAPPTPGALREMLIQDSWRRCQDTYGLEPDRIPTPDVLSQAEFGVVRAPTEELASLAQGEISRMMHQLADHVQLLMMADTNGSLIVVRADPQLASICKEACILPGALFTESSQGTNGIGLCLQTLSPVSVVMEEHYATRLSGLSCTVAPIFGAKGELSAVLNVTSLRPSTRTVHEIARRVVENSARRIENRSFDLRCAGHIVLRLSPSGDFCDPAGEGRIALDDDGRLIDITPAALRMLGQDSGLFGQRLDALGDPDAIGRLLRSPAPAIELPHGRLGIQLAPTSRSSALPRPVGSVSSSTPAAAPISGADPSVQLQLQRAQRLYAGGVPLLLQGETGTGKTQLARALHDQGPRRQGQFVALNCAAIPAELIESELFGYRAGAFTGASRQGARGRLLEADGGTLFLDEIGDMPLALQSRLLQVLSEKEFVPIGATQTVKVDFHLIAASLRDINQMVSDGLFREDLRYRIQGASLRLPALRERSDLDQLIQAVFAQACGRAVKLSGPARLALARHSWPGNIRELEHVARYAAALSESAEIGMDCLPDNLQTALPAPRPPQHHEADSLRATLTRADWNITVAAQWLGISRSTLHRRMRSLNISRPEGQ